MFELFTDPMISLLDFSVGGLSDISEELDFSVGGLSDILEGCVWERRACH